MLLRNVRRSSLVILLLGMAHVSATEPLGSSTEPLWAQVKTRPAIRKCKRVCVESQWRTESVLVGYRRECKQRADGTTYCENVPVYENRQVSVCVRWEDRCP